MKGASSNKTAQKTAATTAVVSGEVKHSLLRVFWHAHRWFRTATLVAGVMLLVVAGGLGARAVINTNRRHHAEALAAQRKALLSQAAPLLGDPQKLAPIVTKIKQQPNYSQDQSYVYVLLNSSIAQSDSQAAQSYFDQLTKLYHSDQGYDPSIRGSVVSYNDLKATVDYLQKQSQDSKSSLFFAPKL